jgi:pSer/pThr/pTyr-binding forkhead associated (FHA) protein
MHASLRVRTGDSVGQTIEISPGKFMIGRDVDCHLRPDSRLVSRHHCVLLLDEFTLRIRDLSSTNGTFVNGHRIGGETPSETILTDGDAVSLGGLALEVVLDGSVEGVRSARVSGGNQPAAAAPDSVAHAPQHVPSGS